MNLEAVPELPYGLGTWTNINIGLGTKYRLHYSLSNKVQVPNSSGVRISSYLLDPMREFKNLKFDYNILYIND